MLSKFSSLLIFNLLFAFLTNGQELDTLKLLQVERLNISSNNFSSNLSVPNFSDYSNDFNFGNKFTTAQLTGFVPIDSFAAKSNYNGFQVNFIFKSNLFKDSLSRVRNKFTFAFEAGTSEANLYQISTNDGDLISYDFRSNTFRLAFGYKRFISKKGKFRIYTGAELINEFNISAAVFENQIGTGGDERKLFARKSYNMYLNAPFGFDWRVFKKASIFFHLNFALGFENLDPIRQVNFYTGSRLGFSLSI